MMWWWLAQDSGDDINDDSNDDVTVTNDAYDVNNNEATMKIIVMNEDNSDNTKWK